MLKKFIDYKQTIPMSQIILLYLSWSSISIIQRDDEMSNSNAEGFAMWEVFLSHSKIWLKPLVKEAALQSASRDSCEGFFVDQQ